MVLKQKNFHYKSYDEGNLRGETDWGASTAPFSRENPNNKSSPFLYFCSGPGPLALPGSSSACA